MKDKLNNPSVHAHWFLRVALAAVFMYHGAQKFGMLDAFAGAAKLPYIVALLVACAEFFGGLLVFVGAFTKDIVTRTGGAFISIVMLGAFFMVHLPKGFDMSNGGFEYVMTLFAISTFFALSGNSFGSCVLGKKK
ncbi:DoxX family protein [Candidatus Peregrinibacteria bacterium]|nr:DoxX family protein [Candidatus Peregrinibacteria bacterium]